jgi:hypothetical protein
MRALVILAWTNVAVHVVGLIVALVGMRPGSPVVSLEERLAYLASHPAGWSLGWGLWMLCALALVAFLAALRPHAEWPETAALAVTFCAVGAGVDFLCDIGQIVVLPTLASARPFQPALFAVWERWLGAGGTVVANGLYSLAILLAAVALRRRLPSYIFGLGLATFGFGMAVVAAGFLDDPRLLELAVGPMFVAFLLWVVAVTRALSVTPR